MNLTMIQKICLGAALATSPMAVAETLHVPDDYPYFFAAIAAASDGDTIAIAAGVYQESYIDPQGKRITIEGETGQGGELLVVINGMQSGAVVFCNSGEDETTVFRNLILFNGSSYYGGGMSNVFNSSPRVENCLFLSNIGTIDGGGLHNRSGCNPRIINCRFENNISLGMGGGIYNEDSSPVLEQCTFAANVAVMGGAISNYQASSPQLHGCMFNGNTAMSGEAIYTIDDGSYPSISGSTFCQIASIDVAGPWFDGGKNTFHDDCTETCPADLDESGTVNAKDIVIILSAWSNINAAEDLDDSGVVDAADITMALVNWGPCIP